jgi:hypothetical protein
MIDYTTAMRIRAKLEAGQRPKVIAIDEGVGLNTVYGIRNGTLFKKDVVKEREIERIRRVTKALEDNPNAPLRQLVRASRVSFGNMKRIMNEYRKR